ncbi:hypothetical protein MP228_004590 [Amoeboaphelidium protococcarum]|nr:hypothetical protein MP228_004590 [Amoeboaphelidium protococcarum]
MIRIQNVIPFRRQIWQSNNQSHYMNITSRSFNSFQSRRSTAGSEQLVKQRMLIKRAYSSNSSQNDGSSTLSRFKQLGKKYGATGFVLYSAMSTTTLSLIFLALWNGVDVEKHIQQAKIRFGLPVSAESDQELSPGVGLQSSSPQGTSLPVRDQYHYQDNVDLVNNGASKKLKGFSWQRVGATFVMAFALNKLLVPLKAPLTVMFTPAVARWWRQFRIRRRNQ